MRVPIAIDRRRDVPLRRQIYEEWRRGILGGRFAAGERMPSTRDLAAALRVSRATVTAAYEQLIAEGYLDGRHGAGTFVSHDLPDRALRAAPAHAARTARAAVRVSRFGTGLAAVADRRPPAPGTIPLSGIGPDLDAFPYPVWSRLVRRHLRHPASLLGYGSGAGHPPLRIAIAAYLRRARAVRCTAEQVIVVSGSQQALDLCARVLVEPGDAVAVEEPGYPGARQVFAAAGARVRPVPVDTDGLVVAALPRDARLAYVTPSHQFPLGVALSLARRLDLLAWAQAADAVVVEDDYDSEFRYRGAPLPALQGLGDASRVIYVGTFSTAMFPGLRLGYLVVPPGLAEPFARAKWFADRHSATLEQAALADFLDEGHFEQHVRRMRRVYGRRRAALIEALQRHFGARATVLGDAAGMHLVARLDDPAVRRRAARSGVLLRDTGDYYSGRAPAGECLLGFASLGERALREAVRRLAG